MYSVTNKPKFSPARTSLSSHMWGMRDKDDNAKMSQHAAWSGLSYGWAWSNGQIVISRKKLKKLEKNCLQCLFIHPYDSPTLCNLGLNTTLHGNTAATVQPTENEWNTTAYQHLLKLFPLLIPQVRPQSSSSVLGE